MKKNKLYIASVAFAALSLVTSCDSFLDKLPDDRAEVNTEEKFGQTNFFLYLCMNKQFESFFY